MYILGISFNNRDGFQIKVPTAKAAKDAIDVWAKNPLGDTAIRVEGSQGFACFFPSDVVFMLATPYEPDLDAREMVKLQMEHLRRQGRDEDWRG